MRGELSEQRAVAGCGTAPLGSCLCTWLCAWLGLLRVAAQVVRDRNQAAFLSLRSLFPASACCVKQS